ncbi:MAG TPA: quinolinate synthase NadA [Rhizomicrobium sp.]
MNVAVQNLKGAEPLPYTPEIARATQDFYKKVAHVIPEIEWPVFAPYVDAINKLKKQKNAVILGHNYMTPEIFNCVSDFTGDSLQLAREAARTDAKVIVQAGVHFMAETSKILSPDKTVLIPDMRAGCSLAASITGADVRLLKQKYPGLPVVTYVNTSADVKAESDVCCTSSNAVAVVEDIAREFGVDTVIMVPDQYLAKNVAKMTKNKIITYNGACEVHERFTPQDIRNFREANPGVVVLTHPECPPEVVAEADFSGSTSAMIGYVGQHQPKKVVLVTECSMSDNVAVEFPKVDFVKPCNLCPHMKRITLPKILHSLETMTNEVFVDPVIAERARKAVERMLAVKMPVQKAA